MTSPRVTHSPEPSDITRVAFDCDAALVRHLDNGRSRIVVALEPSDLRDLLAALVDDHRETESNR